MKQPIEYTKEDLDSILNKLLKVHIGQRLTDHVSESLEGLIINYKRSSIPPYLPYAINFKVKNGGIRKLQLFEIKRFEIL